MANLEDFELEDESLGNAAGGDMISLGNGKFYCDICKRYFDSAKAIQDHADRCAWEADWL